MTPLEQHDIGIILDGNRRYAKRRGLVSVVEGHRAGGENFKRIIERTRDMQADIRVLAAWCMSCKNLDGRSAFEINGIFGIGEEFLTDLRDNWMHRPENSSIRLFHMGRRGRMEAYPSGRAMLRVLDQVSEETNDRTGMAVGLCFDYSGDDEQQRALEAWVAAGMPGSPGTGYRQFLDIPRQGIPYRPLSLIIRTGKEDGESDRDGAFLAPYTITGETRLRSSELLFPEFTPDAYEAVVRAYLTEQKREGK